MFKSRSSAAATDATPASIEVIRVRARQRLIGAAVLVGIGVIGFPLVFDTEPRPLPVDVPIDIPARQMSTPAALPAPMAEPSRPEVAEQATVATRESLDSREEVVPPAPPAKPADAPAVQPEAPPQTAAKPAPKPAAQAEPKTEPAAADAGKAPDNLPTTNARIVVQVGAFADVAKAREVRLKLERAGLKTYTNVAKTPDGDRIRVRMGPFKTKAEADKAAARAKSMGLEAGLYWL